nr:Dam family site-specific DNA-(adenine-N6)-methyltransferase [Campylobacter sp. MIT 99-7217]
MPQLLNLFPKHINTYIEAFCGGGSSFLNVRAKKYLLNDKDEHIINLHRFLSSKDMNFLEELFKLIAHYKLSCSLKNISPDLSMKKEFKKTYFARFNKEAYLNLRADFNADKKDLARLYLLLIYGFNRFLRFNAKGDFNLPVGNVDFNLNVLNALKSYFSFMKGKELDFYNLDFEDFLKKLDLKKDDFIYLDPPYLISSSEYNKLWSEKEEKRLYEFLAKLNSKKLRFGLSNILRHKGKTNKLLEKFMQNYESFVIKSNYISFNDNSIKKDSLEVFIRNYKD